MFIFAFILYLFTISLTLPIVIPESWINTDVTAIAGMVLIFFTLSLIMLLRKRAAIFKLLSKYIMIFVIILSSVEGIIIYRAFKAPAVYDDVNYLIVLGSGQFEQNKLTVELTGRLNKAIEIHEENPALKIILSGGVDKNRGLPQSTAMKEYLSEYYKKLKKRMPDVIIEDESTNTYDSLYLSNEKVKSLFGSPIKSAYIITNSYHFARVELVCSRIGITTVTVKSDLHFSKYPAYFIREAAKLSKSALFDGFFMR